MERAALGGTGLVVTRLGLGTVELGMPYGIRLPGEAARPADAEALQLVRRAVASGVRLLDTAPEYGASERLLGEALDGDSDCVVATKVSAEVAGDRSAVRESVERSARRLRRPVLDLVQLHNATEEMLLSGRGIEALQELKQAGRIRAVGATVYGEAAALAAIRRPEVDVVQVAISLLDQAMLARVLPEAEAAGVGVVARSVLLKGALTPRALHLPSRLRPLREAADRVRSIAGVSWEDLPQLAIRWCLGLTQVSSVLVGVRGVDELDVALEALARGPLAQDLSERLSAAALADPRLVNPVHWGED